MSNVETILESIEKLTLLEAAELVKAMEEKFGVSAAAPVAVAAAAPAAAAEGGAEEASEVTVVLAEAGANKIAVLKEVRAITGLELKNAIELVDNILMSNEMPTDPKLVQVINSINTENI